MVSFLSNTKKVTCNASTIKKPQFCTSFKSFLSEVLNTTHAAKVELCSQTPPSYCRQKLGGGEGGGEKGRRGEREEGGESETKVCIVLSR